MADYTNDAGDASQLDPTDRDYDECLQIQSDAECGYFILDENLSKNTIVTDIANVNYCEGAAYLYQKKIQFAPISKPFCDNIILVKISSKSEYEKKDPELHPRQYSLKSDSSKKNINYLKNQFRELIPKQSDRFLVRELPECFPLMKHTRRYGRAEGTRDIIYRSWSRDDRPMYNNHWCTLYKIDLADSSFEIEILLQKLKRIVKQLVKHDFYMLDIDVTQDFIGVFDKKEMADYLIKNCNFRYRSGDSEEDSSRNVIEVNEKQANCLLEWKRSNSRTKIYNKFVSQMTNPGVRQKIGNHIVDFIQCQRSTLKETFTSDLAKQHGILRLEVTIYNFPYEGNDEKYEPFTHALELLKSYERHLKNAPIYSVSLEKMWLKITGSLHHNCCLVIGDVLQFVYYGNSATGQFTGTQIELPNEPKEREEIISYALSEFSFKNLPIHFVEFVQQDDGLNVEEIDRKCFMKIDQPTYFPTSRRPYMKFLKEYIDIEHTGLVSTNLVSPRISTKRRFELLQRCKLNTIKPTSCNLIPTDYQDAEKNPKKVKRDPESCSQEVNNLLEFFEDENWQNLEPNCEYVVYAVAFRKPKSSAWYQVAVLAKKSEENIRQVYHFKGLRKKDFIDLYNNPESLFEDGYRTVYCNDWDIIFFESQEWVARFQTKYMTSFEGYEFPKVENVVFNADQWQNVNGEDENTIFDLSKRELSSLFRNYNRKELNETGEYVFYAFTVDNTSRYEQVAVLAKEKHDRVKQVYKFKGIMKDEFKKHYNRYSCTPEYYQTIYLDDFRLNYLASEDPIGEFKTNGMVTTRNGYSFAGVEDLKFYNEMIFGKPIERIGHLFADWQNWRDLGTADEYEVYSFSVRRSGTNSFVAVLAKNKYGNGRLKVYRFRGSSKKKFTDIDDDRDTLEEKGFKVIPYDEVDMILLSNEQRIAVFKTDGIVYINEDYSITRVKEFRFCNER